MWRRRVLPPVAHERGGWEGEINYVGKYHRCTPDVGEGRNIKQPIATLKWGSLSGMSCPVG